MNTQYRKNLKAVMQASKDYTDKKAQEILWKIGEYDITTQNDNTSALVKTAPSGATRVKIKRISGKCVKYAPSTASDDSVSKDKVIPENTYTTELNILGGMSYKSENLFNVATITSGVRIDTNGNTYVSASNNTSDYIEIKNGKTYKISLTNAVAIYDSSKVKITTSFNPTDIAYSYTATQDGYLRFSYSNTSTNIMLNEGSTLLPYQPYFEGIRDSAVTNMVVSGTDMSSITKTIPQEIQALEGYGWGINDTCYNYVGLNTKKFVKKTYRVNLGDVNWAISNGCFYTTGLSDKLASSVNLKISNNYTELTGRYSSAQLNASSYDKVVCCDYGVNSKIILVKDTSYTSSSAFKTAMNGVYLYYELETPIETDISSYLPADFNKILTNDNYTNIEFVSDYGYDIPNKVSYYGTIKETLCTQINKNDALAVSLTNNEAKYGWSAGSVANVRDYTTNKGRPKVNRVDLGTLNWSFNSNQPNCFRAALSGIKQINDGLIVPNLSTTNYTTRNQSGTINTNMSISLFSNTSIIFIHDENFTNGDYHSFQAAMSGIYLYYELATEVVEDITPLENNVIEVVEDDELEFVNSENQAVPSEITYRIEVEK